LWLVLKHPVTLFTLLLLLWIDASTLPNGRDRNMSTVGRMLNGAHRGAIDPSTLWFAVERSDSGMAVLFPWDEDWQARADRAVALGTIARSISGDGFWAITTRTWNTPIIWARRPLSWDERAVLDALTARLADDPDVREAWLAQDFVLSHRAGAFNHTHPLFLGYVHDAFAALFALLLLGGLIGWLLDPLAPLRSIRRGRRLGRGECPSCGYDLRGQPSKGCSECGWNMLAAAEPGPGIQSDSTGGPDSAGRP
jgi:hypothetical protein